MDHTADVARSRGVPVVPKPFTSFPSLRNLALDLVETPWVLFVDADERVTPALADEVRAVIGRQGADAPVGYWIPRRNFIWGGWIRHGGWSPDYQLRLLQVVRARYDEGRDVHELVQLNGDAGYLSEPFLHYNYDNLSQFLAKQRSYSSLEAIRLAREQVRARPHSFILQPLREARRRLVELEGFHDGWRGFTLAALLAWYCGVGYVKLAGTRRDEGRK